MVHVTWVLRALSTPWSYGKLKRTKFSYFYGYWCILHPRLDLAVPSASIFYVWFQCTTTNTRSIMVSSLSEFIFLQTYQKPSFVKPSVQIFGRLSKIVPLLTRYSIPYLTSAIYIFCFPDCLIVFNSFFLELAHVLSVKKLKFHMSRSLGLFSQSSRGTHLQSFHAAILKCWKKPRSAKNVLTGYTRWFMAGIGHHWAVPCQRIRHKKLSPDSQD